MGRAALARCVIMAHVMTVEVEERTSVRGSTLGGVRDALLITVAFLLLYIPFRSVDYDPNGIIEAANLEAGILFSRNHIIYRSVGSALYSIAGSLGYAGRSLGVLQVLDAFCGAIGVGLAFVAFQKLGATRRSAFAGALLWGTSFIYWFYSTDVAYVTMAAMFTSAALLCAAILSERQSVSLAVLLGLCLALATLTFQMTLLLFLPLLWPLRRRFRELTACVVVAALIIGGSYVLLGLSEGHMKVADLLRWSGSYAGGLLPEWGRFEAGRIGVAMEAAVRSFQYDVFERFNDLLSHPFQRYAWRIAAGAVCLGSLALVTFLFAVREVFSNVRLIWMVGAYLICFPFIVWFSPSESYWFLIPNLFLCGAATIAWNRWIARPPVYFFVFVAIGTMAAATFVSWVWRRHIDPGVVGRKVDCIASLVQEKDLVVATDWFWPPALSYFHGVRVLSVIDSASAIKDHEGLLSYMADEFRKTTQVGGRVFIVDPASYDEPHMSWLAQQTTFSRADFDRFRGKPSFVCEDARFREVVTLVNGTE